MLRALMATGLALVVGCDDGISNGRGDDILALSGDVATGRTLYTSNCQSCHAADGAGVDDLGANIQETDIDVVVDAVLNGRTGMTAYAEFFSDQQIADIAAFVETL